MQPKHSKILHLAEQLAIAHAASDGINDFDSAIDVEMTILEHAISVTPAASIEDACIQAMLVLSSVADIENNSDREKARKLLWSILKVMTRNSKIDLSRYGGSFYAPAYLDPWEESLEDFDAAVLAFGDAARSDFSVTDAMMNAGAKAAGCTPEQFRDGCAAMMNFCRAGSAA
ncbi:MAG TPA: hypothetical protein VGN75_05575 [Kaistia sp.]|jgi:hypothetical protein|nr:hypothetical protein [Kaistia sp.]